MGTRFQEAGHDAIGFYLFNKGLPYLEDFIAVYTLAQRQGLIFKKGKCFGCEFPLDFTSLKSLKEETVPLKDLYNLIEEIKETTETSSIERKESEINFLSLTLDQEEFLTKIYREINNFIEKELKIYSKNIEPAIQKLLNAGIVQGQKSDLEKKVKVPDFTIFTSSSIYTIESKFEMLPRRASTAKEVLTFNEFAKQNKGDFYLAIPHPNIKEKYPELSIPTSLGRKERGYLNFLKEHGCRIYFFDINEKSEIKLHEFYEVIK